jgi:hypothetical protein
MGFFTTFHIVYPSDPGRVALHDVKRIVEQLLPHCRSGGPKATAHLKFGDSPASSNRPLFSFVPTATPGIHRTISDWDLDSSPIPISEMLNLFADLPESNVHRALIQFGALKDEVANSLRRDPGPENEIGLYPYDVGLSVGPIEAEPDDEDAESARIGWVSFTISGNGYCFPWAYQDFIDRCLKTEICQQARKALLSIFGPPSSTSFAVNVRLCIRRTRRLPDGLVAAVEGT